MAHGRRTLKTNKRELNTEWKFEIAQDSQHYVGDDVLILFEEIYFRRYGFQESADIKYGCQE